MFKVDVKDGRPSFGEEWGHYWMSKEDGSYYLPLAKSKKPLESWSIHLSSTWHGDFNLLALITGRPAYRIKIQCKYMYKEAFVEGYEITDGGEEVMGTTINLITGEPIVIIKSQSELDKEQACNWIDIYRKEWEEMFEYGVILEDRVTRSTPLYELFEVDCDIASLWYSEENRDFRKDFIERRRNAKR